MNEKASRVLTKALKLGMEIMDKNIDDRTEAEKDFLEALDEFTDGLPFGK